MQFEAYPKTPRLFRDIVITEKIDGTNSAVLIEPVEDWAGRLIGDGFSSLESNVVVLPDEDGLPLAFRIQAQSRNRLIQPNNEKQKGQDNHGFAGWVWEHADQLVRALGPGRHFGEWWGASIARKYGRSHRTFSLFNPDFTWKDEVAWGEICLQLSKVPVLYRGRFDTGEIAAQIEYLREHGSVAAPGFMKPEGVIVYHTAARQGFKVLLEHDELPKGGVISKETAAWQRWNGSGC